MGSIVTKHKRLWLVRHGHAVAEAPGGEDFTRELSALGMQQCRESGRVLRQWEGFPPELVLTSAARRTQQTASQLMAVPGMEHARLHSDEKLYLASAGDMLAMLCTLPQDCASVMLVAHNPGLCELALMIGGSERVSELHRRGMPPCTVAGYQFDGQWSALGSSDVTLTQAQVFIPPQS